MGESLFRLGHELESLLIDEDIPLEDLDDLKNRIREMEENKGNDPEDGK